MESSKLEGKVTIVTGGSRGIGKGCVQVFVRNSGKVVFCDVKDELGQEVEKEMNDKFPGSTMFVHADVSKEEEVKAVVAATVEKFGRIDYLINNAGRKFSPKKIDDISLDEFKDLLDTNLFGAFLFAKYSLPHIRKTKGSIVNISSMLTVIAEPHGLTYCTTKGGMSSMTKALACDEAPNGVRVNAVLPATVDSPMLDEWLATIPDPGEGLKHMGTCHLMHRIGTPEEVAKACLFLAVDATFTTGEELRTSGGIELSYGVKTTY